MVDWRVLVVDWGVIVAAILIGIIVWARIEDWLLSAIELRRLKKGGRAIDAALAIREHEGGSGVLVRNQSFLPGDWWFLRNKDKPSGSDPDLLTALRECGYVLVFESRNDRRAIEAYAGQVEVILEPFD